MTKDEFPDTRWKEFPHQLVNIRQEEFFRRLDQLGTPSERMRMSNRLRDWKTELMAVGHTQGGLTVWYDVKGVVWC